MDGIILTPLKIIPTPKGEVMHALKRSETSFVDFGEAYFSNVLHKEIKGWKKHTRMTLNLVVPVGEIRFVIFSDKQKSFFDVILGKNNYQRLTISPNLWVAFQGIGTEQNLLLNLASLEHDPQEAENKELSEINFKW